MRYDVIVIGGGAAGLSFILAAKSLRPNMRILVVRRTKKQPIPCGVPYIVETLGSVDNNIIFDRVYSHTDTDLIVDEVVEIDRKQKKIITESGADFEYKKLIIATGSRPVKLSILGIDLENVILIHKEYEHLVDMFRRLKNAKRIVIIGAGFVGLEFADDLVEGKDIHIVEILDEALSLSFDKEFGEMARRELEAKGVKFHFNTSVKEILGDRKVERVILNDGEEIVADAVVVSVGVAPNSGLARKAGLDIDNRGHIIVDDFMRTSDPDIYAIGDVAQKKCFFTKQSIKAYFSSIAVIEARIAALHICGVKISRLSSGVLLAYSTVVGDLSLAAVGLTEKMAKKMGYNVYAITVEAVNRHPGILPGARDIVLKAIFNKEDLRLLGVQIAGPECVGELINYAVASIQMNLTAYDIIQLQMATHPMLTSSPIGYPLHKAALSAIAQKENEGLKN